MKCSLYLMFTVHTAVEWAIRMGCVATGDSSKCDSKRLEVVDQTTLILLSFASWQGTSVVMFDFT